MQHGTSAKLCSFEIGTGKQILENVFNKVRDTVQEELIFVTCFWARSESLQMLSTLLRDLSRRALGRPSRTKIRVRLCLSSISVTQKLLDWRTESGREYSPGSWASELWLPDAQELQGLDMHVICIFKRPFSVMHPKFIIVDRKAVYLPSCNVSWENWFEGCAEMHGPIVDNFLHFWNSFWCRDKIVPNLTASDQFEQGHVTVSAHFLPSEHSRNPRFRPFPWQDIPPPSPTRLNLFTLQQFDAATRSIFILSPNITSLPAVAAMERALMRGVDIRIVTNEQLMTVEQLITAGTTTPRCLNQLVQRYRLMRRRALARLDATLETGLAQSYGELCIDYYSAAIDGSKDHASNSHLKLTIFDEEHILLGSGNMDRASWYTSQELGVALQSRAVVSLIRQQVDEYLHGRLLSVFDSLQA